MEQARIDAAAFMALLPPNLQAPVVGEGEDEVVVEWLAAGHRAIVSFDGDGMFGYAMQDGDRFRPGAEDGVLDGRPLPADLIEHLRQN